MDGYANLWTGAYANLRYPRGAARRGVGLVVAYVLAQAALAGVPVAANPSFGGFAIHHYAADRRWRGLD